MSDNPREDRWQSVERLYLAASVLPPGDRAAFLDDACAGDAGLRAEVESLLRYAPAAEAFMETPAAAAVERDEVATLAAETGEGPDLIGREIGEFRVVSRLGSGGMGEVYRAHDSRLGRDVAIKVLPFLLVHDAERLRRFQREARLLASLNHPNIAAIYGLAGNQAMPALILELVEGPTLADLVARAASSGRGMKIDQVTSTARQIVDALEAAHDKGVVHRDLKPANVKLTRDGTVKVLDFGVAKALSRDSDARDPAQDSVVASSDTRHGIVIGTPNYMSPEQARGEPVDKRCDIWAFGCVLFEMLTGRPTFGGKTTSETLTAVLERDPDWSALPDATPPGLGRLLKRCLERSLKRRLRDIGDARLDLDELEESPAQIVREAKTTGVGTWIVATAAAALTTLVLIVWARPEPARTRVQFSLDPPPGWSIAGVPLPSPDGSRLAVVARTSTGESAIWVRELDSSSYQRVPGTENATRPFWSPDGQSIGFGADGSLKRASLTGGPVQRITDLEPILMGATWNRDDVIVFTPTNKSPLHRVSAGGTGREPLTALDASRRENSHRWPHFLPDGRHFLFLARSDLPEYTGIYLGSLDAPGSPKWLIGAQSSAAVYEPSGHVLFVRDNTILAQPFDLRTLELSGEPIAVGDEVQVETSSGEAFFASSTDGSVLTHLEAAGNHLAWFDRSGRQTAVAGPRGTFSQVQLSPDGSRAAVVEVDRQNGNRDVWLISLADGSLSRLTSHPANDWFPVWSPDGSELIFASDRDTTLTFYRVSVDGAGPEQLVFKAPSPGAFFPTDWSRDGRTLLFHSYPRGDVSLLPLAGGAPVPFVESPFTDWVASLSPDGRWVAYVSDESGIEQVYVRPMQGAGKFRVSSNGGIQARWRDDSRELFFVGPANELMSVTIGPGPRFTASPPTRLFDSCTAPPRNTFNAVYDIVADGSRSLWICPGNGNASALVSVNWSNVLTAR